jgi:hypothetical protein
MKFIEWIWNCIWVYSLLRLRVLAPAWTNDIWISLDTKLLSVCSQPRTMVVRLYAANELWLARTCKARWPYSGDGAWWLAGKRSTWDSCDHAYGDRRRSLEHRWPAAMENRVHAWRLGSCMVTRCGRAHPQWPAQRRLARHRSRSSSRGSRLRSAPAAVHVGGHATKGSRQ